MRAITKGWLMCALSALAFGVVSAPAHAALSWTATGAAQSLSPGGVQSSDVHVATDAAGDAIAAWKQCAHVCGIYEAYRPAGANFGPEHEVDVGNGYAPAENPWVTMDAKGDAIIAWDGPDYATNATFDYTYYAYRPAGGESQRFQHFVELPQTTADSHAALDYDLPRVAMDSAGDAVLAIEHIDEAETDGTKPTQIWVAYRPAGPGTNFGAFSSLNPVPTEQPPHLPPSVAMDAAGDAVVAREAFDPGQHLSGVSAAYRLAGPTSTYHTLDVSTQARETYSGRPSAGIDSAGNVVVAWDQVSNAGPRAIWEADLPHGASTFTTPAQVSGTSVEGSTPQVQVGPTGDTWIQWAQTTSVGAPLSQVDLSYRPAGGGFGAPQLVTGSTYIGESLGIDGQDRPAELSLSQDPNNNYVATLEATSRDAGPGPFTTPATLVSGVAMGPGGSPTPQLSVSAGGQAVAVWQEVLNGDLTARAAFGTPAGAPPPPPPPSPPPPIPSAINPATPMQSGQAIVLTASVPADTVKLVWTLSGGAGSGTFTNEAIGSSALQRSIRFRPTPGQLFTVEVDAYDEFGRGSSSSRTFLAPNAPTDSYWKAINSRVANRPRVYGIGDEATLLGKTSCGFVTVYTGKHKFSGCLRPVTKLADIPGSELASTQALGSSLGVDLSDPKLMNATLQRVDGYVGVGPSYLDNHWKVSPNLNAKLVSFPGIGPLTSSGASIDIGGVKLGGGTGPFSLNIDPGKIDIPLGSLPKPSLPDIGGFPIVGNWNVDLGLGDADIDTSIELPSWLDIGGVPLHIPVKFKATPNGLVLDNLDIGPFNADIGGIGVTGFRLTYDRAKDTWVGSAKVCVLTGLCLDMTPPFGEVKVIRGNLNYAGATLRIPDPGLPLFAGVNLTYIGFGLGLDPTRMYGRAGITVADIVALNGTLVAAFPRTGHPFILSSDEAGSDFPANLYGKPFSEPTIGASADVGLNLPNIGQVTLGKGYLLYEVPDFIAVGGGVDLHLAKVIDLGGSINGAANFSDGTVNLNAELHACLLVIHKLCANAVADISRGPHSAGGAGACIGIAGFNVGGGILWKRPFDPLIWPFDGCKWSRFKVDVNPSAAGANRRTMVVHRGQPNPALRIFGRGGPPLVRVTGPGGQSLDSTDSGFDHSPGGKIRILRYAGQRESFTVIGLENARPGRYIVTALPGSAPFTDTETATDLPDARVSATVSGSGEHRALHYTVRRRPGQTVTFWDSDSGRAGAPIGHLSGGGSGTLHFTAPPGNRRRTIYAQFALAGLPAERIRVGSYRPPAPTLATPRHLRVGRHATKLTASWNPVAEATGYEVTLTDPVTGAQRVIRTHGHRIVITRLATTFGGTLAVRAVEPRYDRAGLTARASVKRLANPTSRFVKLGRCKLKKGHLTCVGGPPLKPPAKKKPAPKKKAAKPKKR